MTTLSASDISRAADDLFAAEKSCRQIDPVSMHFPAISMAQAYQIQQEWVSKKVAAGDKVIGYKVGLTSRAMQAAMNIDVPDYGVLLNSMEFASGAEIEAAQFCDPRIEVELAFVLGARLGGADLSIEDVIDATEYVVPALELIAARSYRTHPETGYTRKVFDTISDNAANAGIIAGDVRIDPRSVDLRWCGATLSRNGVVEETGLAAGVLGHPARGIIEVARMFASHNTDFQPGQIILSGSFTRPVVVSAGDEIIADYNALGQISCRFV